MSKAILYQAEVPNSDTLAFTATQPTAIDKATVINTSGGAVTLTVHIMDGGGAAADSGLIYSAHSIGTDTSPTELTGLVNHGLEAGDTIRVVAGSASALSLTISGRQ